MMRQPMSGHTSAEMQECIANCTECHTICLATIQHCLQQGGKHAKASHIRRKALGELDLGVTGPSFVTAIFQPLAETLRGGRSWKEDREFDQDGGQTGAFCQHPAVNPERPAQGMSRP